MDFEITIPPAPENPCIKRKKIKISTFGERRQAIVEMENKIMESSNGFFLPYLSLSGPRKTCPTARPIMQKVRLSCTREAVVLKNEVKLGRAGR